MAPNSLNNSLQHTSNTLHQVHQPAHTVTSQQTANALSANLLQAPANQQQSVMSESSFWDEVKKHPLYHGWRKEGEMAMPTFSGREKKNTSEKMVQKEKPEAIEKIITKEKQKDEVSELPKEKKLGKSSSTSNVSYNPLARGRHRGKSAVQGAISVPTRIIAKAAHIVSRPQQLFTGEARSDVAINTGRGVKNLFRGFTGAFYKPHRTPLAYENVFKDYGAGRGPGQTQNPAKLFAWGFSKFIPATFLYPVPVKFAAHMVQGVTHAIADTAQGKNDYTLTKQAFKKAFSWNYTTKGSGT